LVSKNATFVVQQSDLSQRPKISTVSSRDQIFWSLSETGMFWSLMETGHVGLKVRPNCLVSNRDQV